MATIKRMDQIRNILRTFITLQNILATSRCLGVARNTVKTYIRRVSKAGLTHKQALDLTDDDLERIVYEDKSLEENNRLLTFNSYLKDWIEELKSVGVTRQILWEDYISSHPDGYQYSQFCDRFKRHQNNKQLTIKIDHIPGDVMQVDFAGKTLSIVDQFTGEVISCQVLIAVMSFSQHTFAIALPSQKVGDFVYGLNEALSYFGGLPRVILSDNLKSYVTQSDRYEPKFNDLCSQVGAHYHIELRAARVAKPKDKASVEGAVRNVYTRIYAPLRHDTFYDIESLNLAIKEQLSILNNKPYQKKQGSRDTVFHQIERPLMRDLPCDLFEIKKSTKAKVQKNYHIFLGEDKNYYSVPHQYCGKSSIVNYTRQTVEIFIDTQRVAIHNRLINSQSHKYITNEEHMPQNHLEWIKQKGYTSQYFIKQAELIGPNVLWSINYILLKYVHEQQGYKSCQGILHLSKKYDNQRLENAAKRCKDAKRATYTMFKNILEKNLDHQTGQQSLFEIPKHLNIRGQDYYQ